MTYTLREAIAELDAAADAFVTAVKTPVEEFRGATLSVLEKAEKSDFLEAEYAVLGLHMDNIIKPRISGMVK